MAEDCQVRNWQTLLGPDHQLILIKLPLIELWAMSFHIEFGCVRSQLGPLCFTLFRDVFIGPYFNPHPNLTHCRLASLVFPTDMVCPDHDQ